MPSRNTYRLAWVSLTLDVGYLFTAAPAKQPLLLTLDEGYLLTAAPPDLERRVAPLSPPGIHLMNLILLYVVLYYAPKSFKGPRVYVPSIQNR